MALIKRLSASAPIILVFCLALFVRIVYNVTVARGYFPTFDAELYNSIGHNIVNFHCYCLYPPLPNVSRPPLWPFIMAIIDLFSGRHEAYLRLFYCFLGSGTCVLVYIFAKNYFGRRIALLTGIMAAIYTGLFIYDGWLYTESLYTFCLTAFAYSLLRLQQASPLQGIVSQGSILIRFPSWRQSMVRGRWTVLCGILFGLTSLTRPNGPILLGLICLWAVIVTLARILPRQTVIQDVLIILCIGTALIVPWTYRNYVVTGKLILVSTGMGETLKGAYNDIVLRGDPGVRGMWRPPPNSLNHDALNYTPENDTSDMQAAFTWIRWHPGAMPYLLSLHFINMWIPYAYSHGLPMEEFPDRLSSKVLRKLIPWEAIPVFTLAALGLVLTWKWRRKQLLVVYLVIAFTIVQNIVFYGSMRFRAPIEPLLVLLVGGTLWWLISAVSGTLHLRCREEESTRGDGS